MRINNDKLPAVAKNGFFYCTNKHYGQYVAMAPVKETAKRLYCCEVLREEVGRRENSDTLYIMEAPSNTFRKGCQGSAYVYVVPKNEYPKTHEFTLDMGR